MIFKSTSQADVIELKPFIDRQHHRACGNTIGVLYQWGEYYGTEYAIEEGMAFIKDTSEGSLYFTLLEEYDYRKALGILEEQAGTEGSTLRYLALTENEVNLLKEHFGTRIESVKRIRDLDDYLYEVDKLQTFAGKKLHGQKNHLNRFKALYPEYKYVEITKENIQKARSFLESYAEKEELKEEIKLYELKRATALLDVIFQLDQKAGYIETDEGIVALAIGEVQNDTLFVHAEKALTSVPGAYQAMVSEFALHAVEPDTVYINREDDAGDDGLRTSKMNYHPCGMVEKYIVTIRL